MTLFTSNILQVRVFSSFDAPPNQPFIPGSRPDLLFSTGSPWPSARFACELWLTALSTFIRACALLHVSPNNVVSK